MSYLYASRFEWRSWIQSFIIHVARCRTIRITQRIYPKWLSRSVSHFTEWCYKFIVSSGHNRCLFRFGNWISHCAIRISDSCSTKPLFGWLYGSVWSHVPFRGNRDRLSKMRFWFFGLCFTKRFVFCFKIERKSNHRFNHYSIRNSSRLFRSYLDRNFRRQIFFSHIFQKAHHPRDQNSAILLDCRSDRHGLMAFHGSRTSRGVSAS